MSGAASPATTWSSSSRIGIARSTPSRELTAAAELLERNARGFTSSEDKHWSVWTRESFLELCAAAGFPIVDSLDPDDKVGNGFMVVIDAAAARRPENRERRSKAAASTG